MTTPESDDDDVEINPLTMLLLNDDAQERDGSDQKSPLLPTPVQHQTYHLASIASTVVIRQLPSQGLSFQLWPAANTFVNLLDRHNASESTPFSAAITHLLSSVNGRKLRVLELGSGTGVLGIAAAAILGADVTVTDLPHVLPNLTFNAEANTGILGQRGGAVHVAALSWGESEEMEAIGRGYDLIIGSDVVYHDNLYDPLLQTLKFFLLGCSGDGALEEKKKKVFLMAHLRRWKKESVFFKKAKKHFEVAMIHGDGPSSASRTGVVVYRFARKDAVFR